MKNGIICDNWKVSTYVDRLRRRGWHFTLDRMEKKRLTVIRVEIALHELDELALLVQNIEEQFKSQKN